MFKHIMTTTALVALLALPSLAQEASDQSLAPAPPPGATDPLAPALPPLVAVDLSAVTAAELIGSPVVNAAEENLGEIDDVLFAADGKLESVVISFGGFLGFGAKTVEVPIDQITVKSRGDGAYTAQTDLTPEALEALPEYQKG